MNETTVQDMLDFCRKRQRRLEFEAKKTSCTSSDPPLPMFPREDSPTESSITVVPETQDSSYGIPCSQRRIAEELDTAGELRIETYSASFVHIACGFRSEFSEFSEFTDGYSFQLSGIDFRQRMQWTK